MLQLDFDNEYMEALAKIAKSHKESRRSYWADYLRKVCDSIPGLMDNIRNDIRNNYAVPEPKGEMGQPKEHVVTGLGSDYKDPLKQVKGYRFRYLDESKNFLDGYGTGPKDALFNATGRRWTNDEYYETFMPTPDYIPS